MSVGVHTPQGLVTAAEMRRGLSSRSGNVVFAIFRIDDTAIENSYNWKTDIARMPEGYRPFLDVAMPAHYDGQDAHVVVTIKTDGQVSVWCSKSPGGTIIFTGTYFVL